MDFDQLTTFIEVAKLGNFSRAGQKVFRSQSAVSAQIRSLERLTGVRVLERSRGARSLALTREGAILLRYATEIVARFEAVAAHLVGGLTPHAR